MTEKGNDKGVFRSEIQKLFPELVEFDEILDQTEMPTVERGTTYEVKEVNKKELETIKRSALSRGGRFEKAESNESRTKMDLLYEIRDKLTDVDKKMDKIINYLEME